MGNMGVQVDDTYYVPRGGYDPARRRREIDMNEAIRQRKLKEADNERRLKDEEAGVTINKAREADRVAEEGLARPEREAGRRQAGAGRRIAGMSEGDFGTARAGHGFPGAAGAPVVPFTPEEEEAGRQREFEDQKRKAMLGEMGARTTEIAESGKVKAAVEKRKKSDLQVKGMDEATLTAAAKADPDEDVREAAAALLLKKTEIRTAAEKKQQESLAKEERARQDRKTASIDRYGGHVRGAANAARDRAHKAATTMVNNDIMMMQKSEDEKLAAIERLADKLYDSSHKKVSQDHTTWLEQMRPVHESAMNAATRQVYQSMRDRKLTESQIMAEIANAHDAGTVEKHGIQIEMLERALIGIGTYAPPPSSAAPSAPTAAAPP